MYIESVRIENLKCFEHIFLEFKASRMDDDNYDPQRNWNVILGDNGDGKTTLLQAIAIGLMDVTTAQRVVKPYGWVRNQKSYSRLTVNLSRESNDLLAKTNKNDTEDETPSHYQVEYMIDNMNGGRIFSLLQLYELATYANSQIDNNMIQQALNGQQVNNLARLSLMDKSKREKGRGWISCGYGPFRRLYGLSPQAAKVTDPLEERFITLFDEGAALYKCEDWLKELQRLAALKNDAGSPEQIVFEKVKKLIVELLPEIDEIKLNKEIQFLHNGSPVSLNQLSDGYRSMFALVVDLLRWLEMLRSDAEKPINEAHGVVLIDEIDTHLHPKWQREIGFWLTKIFPNMQFIVTSHSPFVAMAAGKGALTVLEKRDDVVVADQEHPYIRDWTVDQVLTNVFEVNEHSWETERKLNKYDELRSKQIAGTLNQAGQQQLAQLEFDLNQDLVGDPASPKQRTLESDLAELELLLQQELE